MDRSLISQILRDERGGTFSPQGVKKQRFRDRVSLFGQDIVVIGTVSSLAKTIMAPLERVKILLQTQIVLKQIPQDCRYCGIIDALRRVIREQGFLTLWRGNGVNLLRYFPTALNFAFKDVYKQLFMPRYGTQIGEFDYALRNLACGGAAGATSVLFVYPLDLSRTRVTTDINRRGHTRYRNVFQCLYDVRRTEGGVRALYRGVGISLIGIVSYRAFYFGGYDNIKRYLLPKDPPTFILFFAAQTSTCLAQMFSYPLDTTRRYLHLRGGGVDKLYSGTMDCCKKMYSAHGWSIFYRGFLASNIRSIGGAFSLVVFDSISKRVKFNLA